MRWGREEDRAFLRTLPLDAPAIAGAPDLWPDCVLYMDAFGELSLTRPQGMGTIGCISVSDVVTWGLLAGVEDLETLWRHVHALDVTYVADFFEKQKRDAGRNQKQPRGDH